MYSDLLKRSKRKELIRVGMIGTGIMGAGICYQISITPGMCLSFVGDTDISSVVTILDKCKITYREVNSEKDAKNLKYGEVAISSNCNSLFNYKEILECDVFIESTNSVDEGTKYCIRAIENGYHVVLMNAEVDLWAGRYLKSLADEKGVVLTSDAGDQHGVLIRLYNEIKMYGLKPIQLGNIKGFLNRYATANSLIKEAEKRNLNPIQCCSYTDGTKLSIEMSILSNATGMLPIKPGMEGPKVAKVEDVLDSFDFSKYSNKGHVDYVLGAEPGGGVYIVAYNEKDFQIPYLDYYKLGKGPYYLFYRHYHLCHFETPYAVYEAAINKKSILSQEAGYLTDVYAYAKKDLKAGDVIVHAIGGDEFYGMIGNVKESKDMVPIGIMESESESKCILKKNVAKDDKITFDDVELPKTELVNIFNKHSKA